MGLRDFLFEKEESNVTSSCNNIIIDDQPQVEETKVKNTELEGLIENIYSENNLSDKAKSIFKVDEAISALPNEMPHFQKLNSVISILQITGLSKEEVIADANNRLSILNGAKQYINKLNFEDIVSSEQEINKLNEMINTINQSIYQTKVRDEKTTNKINEEIEKITKLFNFLEEDGENK